MDAYLCLKIERFDFGVAFYHSLDSDSLLDRCCVDWKTDERVEAHLLTLWTRSRISETRFPSLNVKVDVAYLVKLALH